MERREPDQVRWERVHESELSLGDHEAIAAMLARAFGDWSFWYVGARSWAGMEPEVRVVATTASGVVVAHAGIRRQFVRTERGSVLVASVGAVAVAPDVRGCGLGRRLMDRVGDALRDLDVRLAVLHSDEDRSGFFGASGWTPLTETTVTYTDYSANGAGLSVTDDAGWFALFVRDEDRSLLTAVVAWDGQLV